MKRAAAPVTNRALARVDDRVDDAARNQAALVAEVDGRLQHDVAAVRARLDGIEVHLPAVLNAISSQNAAVRQEVRRIAALEDRLGAVEAQLGAVEAQVGGFTEHVYDHVRRADEEAAAILHARIGDVEQRVEFVRRELMYELRYAGPATERAAAAPLPPPDLSRIDRSAPIRLNLGAGHVGVDGYLNVDARDLEGIDVVADVRDLPFDDGEVAEIFASHLLEHFPEEELRRSILPHWRAKLAPGGTLVVVVPDMAKMLEEHAAGAFTFDELRIVTFGDQEYEGDFHHTMFTPASLTDLLVAAGFVEVTTKEAGRRNGLCYEMELHARAPE